MSGITLDDRLEAEMDQGIENLTKVADGLGRLGSWTQTYRGRMFWPLDPRPREIFIDDVAHSLAHQCRFAGHTSEFYSVAQHCCLVSELTPAGEDPLWGLLHDGPEAYLVDVPRPVKIQSEFRFYRNAEKALMAAFCVRFGLSLTQPAWVSYANGVLLATEKRDLMAPHPMPWSPLPPPMEGRIRPMSPRESERAFLAMFEYLMMSRAKP